MIRLLLVCLLLPVIATAKNPERSKVYVEAISQYIKAVRKSNKGNIDTLYVGQYTDLKNVMLPPAIQGTRILLLKAESDAESILRKRTSFEYVNIAQLEYTGRSAKIAFVAFYVEKSHGKVNWWPKHNYFVDLKIETSDRRITCVKARFEYPYAKSPLKKGKP